MSATRTVTSDTPATLYITVGPPCAGKTTWLRNNSSSNSDNNSNSIVDVSIDDQEGVYRPLPSHCFVQDDPVDNVTLQQETVLNKTLYERLTAPEQGELRCVCQFLAGTLTAAELHDKFTEIHSAASSSSSSSLSSPHMQTALTAAVVNIIVQEFAQHELPPTVDLFCREVLFLSDRTSDTNGTVVLPALERAFHSLRNVSVSQPVAWGNTNVRSRDYQKALQMAAEQGRPVKFVVFDALRTNQTLSFSSMNNNNNSNNNTASSNNDEDGKKETNNSNNGTNTENYPFAADAFDLKADSFQELMRRNMKRLVTTGRYVPSLVIWDMLQRCRDSLLQTREGAVDLQQELARACSFELLRDGTVRPDRKRPWEGRSWKNAGNSDSGRGRGRGRGRERSFRGGRSGGDSVDFRGRRGRGRSNYAGRGYVGRGRGNARGHDQSRGSNDATWANNNHYDQHDNGGRQGGAGSQTTVTNYSRYRRRGDWREEQR